MQGGTPFLIGHSHSGALVEGARACSVPVDLCSLWFEKNAWRRSGAMLRLREDIAERVARADTVISTLGGGAYLVLALFAAERPFDVVLPGTREDDLLPGAERIPVAALRAAMQQSEALALRQLEAVATHARGRLLHLLAPPCTRVWEPGSFEQLAARMARLHKKDTPPPRPVVTSRFLRLWSVMTEIHVRAAREFGAEAVAPPVEALDAAGWLRADYAQDFAHGNVLYGVAALAQMGLWSGSVPAAGTARATRRR